MASMMRRDFDCERGPGAIPSYQAYQAFIAVMVLARNEADMTRHEVARRIKKASIVHLEVRGSKRRLDVPEYCQSLAAVRVAVRNPGRT